MKERPILFSAPMVRAILEGRKTKTRRVVKGVPEWCDRAGYTCFTPDGYISFRGNYEDKGPCEKFIKCPYGKVGDQFWVRETFAITTNVDREKEWPSRPHKNFDNDDLASVIYRADGEWEWVDDDGFRTEHSYWKPSIFMPRWASRIQLEITGTRVERLQDISEYDAIAEGVGEHWICSDSMPDNPHLNHNPLSRFIDLWKSINGEQSWNQNPWVWVIEFKRIK